MKKNGFTLVEILVGSLILAVLVLGTANLFLSAKRYIRHARLLETSSEFGKTLIDALHMDVRQDQWGANCLSASLGCPGGQDIDRTTYNPNYMIENVSGTKLRRVRLKVNWNEP